MDTMLTNTDKSKTGKAKTDKPSIAIIGAGIAGISTALQLQEFANVTVFEKSRGVGRLATRYKGEYQFDFGAPSFSMPEENVHTTQDTLLAAMHEVVAPWNASEVSYDSSGQTSQIQNTKIKYAAKNKMTAVGRHLASKLHNEIVFKTRVEKLTRITNDTGKPKQWQLFDDNQQSLGIFDWVISAAPLEQARELIPNDFNGYAQMQQCKTDACFVLMLGLKVANMPLTLQKLVQKSGYITFTDSKTLATMVVENSKHTHLGDVQDTNTSCSLTVFSDNAWAETQTAADKEDVKQLLLQTFCEEFGVTIDVFEHIDMHRWLYANVAKAANTKGSQHSCLFDADNKLAAVGDWCVYGSVRAALQSSNDVVSKIAEQFS